MEKRTAIQTPENVPYIVYEGEMARQERQIKRLWIALIVSVIAIVLTVASFLLYLNQYDFTSYDQNGEGVNIIGDGNGVVDYGTESTYANEEKPINGEGKSDPETA